MRTVKFRFNPGVNEVTADDVVRAMRTLLGATGDLSVWRIRRMKFESPLMIEATCPVEAYTPVAAFVRRMMAISEGKKLRGGFSGLQSKLLDSVDFVTKSVFGAVEIAPAGVKAVSINSGAVARAREVTGQLLPSLIIHRREQMGQLRGYLEQITAKRGQCARFGIRDRVSGDLIDCFIQEGSTNLLQSAADALAKYKRVVVTGVIHFGEQSRPTSIQAALIESIEERVIPFDKLPKMELTDNGDSVGYVRRLRDGS